MTKPKPKTKPVEVPQPAAFDYEQDDAKYDGLSRTGNQPYEFEMINPTPPDLVPAPPAQFPIRTAEDMALADQLFLIEGRVRLDQTGRNDPIFADQKRLVWAQSFEQAVQKYNAYFAGLSNFNEKYTVVSAGGSEAIS